MENLEGTKNKSSVSTQFKYFNTSEFELTTRETEILKLILDGFENKSIAKKLFISTKTVEAHKQNLKDKLNIKSIKELYSIF